MCDFFCLASYLEDSSMLFYGVLVLHLFSSLIFYFSAIFTVFKSWLYNTSDENSPSALQMLYYFQNKSMASLHNLIPIFFLKSYITQQTEYSTGSPIIFNFHQIFIFVQPPWVLEWKNWFPRSLVGWAFDFEFLNTAVTIYSVSWLVKKS